MSVQRKGLRPLLLVSAVLATGCTGSDGDVDAHARAVEFTEMIRERGGIASRMVSPDSLTELLPNRQYPSPAGGLFSLSDAVIVGHVTTVAPGRAYYVPGDDAVSGTEIPFDDPRVTSRTIHAEVVVEEVIAGKIESDTIVVGFGIGGATPFDIPAEGLPAMGEMVFFLEDSSPVFAYDPDLYSVAEDGAMLAEVESGGRLTLPAIEPGRSERLLSRTATLQSLRAAAQSPTRVEPLATVQEN